MHIYIVQNVSRPHKTSEEEAWKFDVQSFKTKFVILLINKSKSVNWLAATSWIFVASVVDVAVGVSVGVGAAGGVRVCVCASVQRI